MKDCYSFRDFSQIEVGDTEEFEVFITPEKQKMFVDLFGDRSPIHTSQEISSRTNYGKPIGYAYMLTGFLSKLYGEYLPGGNSICIKQECEFVKPYFVGDNVRIVGKVTRKLTTTKFIEIYTEIYRDRNECIFRGKGLVQIVFEKKDLIPLYNAENEDVFYNDISKAIREMGIKKGDRLFIHSDIKPFGKLATYDRKWFLNTWIDALKKNVGKNGTIIMPTFTYSFCNNEVYDTENSKTSVGVLNEFFRQQSDVSRTNHPIFSVGVWGEKKDYFLDISKDSFDENSIFGKVHSENAKIIFIGTKLSTCTFLHYIEQSFKVPYRYIKIFNGVIKDRNSSYEDECTYFVRNLDDEVILDTSRLEYHLNQKGLIKCSVLGNSKIMVINSRDLFDEVFELLKKNIKYLLKEEI